MKFSYLVIFLILCSSLAHGENKFTYKNNQEVTTEELFSASPELLIGSYARLRNHHKKAGKLEEFKEALSNNPGIEKYLTDELSNIEDELDNYNERRWLIYPLGDIKKEWSVRLLMDLLMNKKGPSYDELEEEVRKVESGKKHWEYVSIKYQAHGSLSSLKIKGAPLYNGPGPSAYAEWVEWWERNEFKIADILSDKISTTNVSVPREPKPLPLAQPKPGIEEQRTKNGSKNIILLLAIIFLIFLGFFIRKMKPS